MGIASVAIQLARKGLKPIINEAQRTLSYATKQGVQKTLLFDTAGKVKYWSSVNPETGGMKIYQNLSNTLSKRTSTVEEFSSYSQKIKTTTITTEKDFNTLLPSKQTVSAKNHITEITKTKENQGVKAVKSKSAKTDDGVQNSTPKMKYKKAKTLWEAKEYARTHLGIERFDVPDLEIANQINYSLTKAYNKTGGKMKNLFQEVEYAPAISQDFKGYRKDYKIVDCAAQARGSFKNNKLEKCVLRINKSFFDNLDNSLYEIFSECKSLGQLTKNKNGKDIIDLCTGYRYSDTLNRYYRLYLQGKLTPKAKYDFKSLLCEAREEENLLLHHTTSVTATVKKELGIDLSRFEGDNYLFQGRKALLQLKKQKGYMLGTKTDLYKTRGAVGLDGSVLHEAGHAWHYQNAFYSDLKNNKALNSEDFGTALEISKYATENDKETVAEYIAGVLSNDKYSQPVKNLVNRILNKKVA